MLPIATHYGYKTNLLTPQYSDNDSTQPGWLRALNADYLGLWEAGTQAYVTWSVDPSTKAVHWPTTVTCGAWSGRTSWSVYVSASRPFSS
jgi:hypothetical protein